MLSDRDDNNESISDPSTALGYDTTSIIKQKNNYLISAHESFNILGTNGLVTVSSLLSLTYALLKEEAEKTSANEQKKLAEELKQWCAVFGVVFSAGIIAPAWLVSLRKAQAALTAEEQKKYYDDIKNQLNPWYRCFKACSAFGGEIGKATVEILYHIPGVSLLLETYKPHIKAFVSSLFSIIIGLIGAALLVGGGDIRSKSDDSLFHIGKDGWGRYAKTGLSLGGMIGAALAFIGGTFGLAMSIGGGILGFLLMTVGVPAVNYLIKKLSPPFNYLISKLSSTFPILKKLLSTPKETSTIKNNPGRTKYMRSGFAWGLQVGTVVGFFLGLVLPGTASFWIPVCNAIGASLGALILGIAGKYISAKISKDDLSHSSFDFGMSTGGIWGQVFGQGIAGITEFAGIAILKLNEFIIAFANLLGICIGGSYDGVKARNRQRNMDKQYKARQAELMAKFNAGEITKEEMEEKLAVYKKELRSQFDKDQPFVPWSQRVGNFLTFGSTICSGIGFFVGGPLGAAIGFIVGATVIGLIGAIGGEKIYEGYIKLTEHISAFLFNTPPPTEKTPVSSPSALSKFFSTSTSPIKSTADSNPPPILPRMPSSSEEKETLLKTPTLTGRPTSLGKKNPSVLLFNPPPKLPTEEDQEASAPMVPEAGAGATTPVENSLIRSAFSSAKKPEAGSTSGDSATDDLVVLGDTNNEALFKTSKTTPQRYRATF